MSKIKVLKIKNNFIIQKQDVGDRAFTTTPTSVIMHSFYFSSILKHMLFSGLLSPKVLEGLLDEYNNRFN